MSGGGSRVSIPTDVRPTIEAIKAFADIKANHTDDEIFAMLKECAMDPNYAAQMLLTQDTFHEVKRKSKKKESAKEPADPWWRTEVHGRGGRAGRGGYSSHFVSNDIASGRNIASKENGVNQGPVLLPSKSPTSNSPVMAGTETKSTSSISSSVPAMVNGPSKKGKPMYSRGYISQISCDSGMALREEASVAEVSKTETSKSIPNNVKGGSAPGHSVSGSEHFLSIKSRSVSGVYASASDPVLVTPLDAHNPGEVGTIKCVIGSQRMTTETTNNKSASWVASGIELSSTGGKVFTDINSSYGHEKMHIKSQGSEGSQHIDAPQVASSPSFTGPGGSRPSSNNSNRSQQPNSSQKAVPSKEWKPKSTPANSARASGMLSTSDVPTVVEAFVPSVLASCSVPSEEANLKIEKKLDELQLSDRQHVIIPSHLQVPESERHGLSFGSFEANFKLKFGLAHGPVSDKNATPPCESSQEIEEIIEQPSSSIHSVSTVQEAEYPDHPQSPSKMPENYSSHEAGISDISGVQEYDQAKQEPALTPEGPQYSIVQTAPYSAFGLVPQMLGSQFTPFESTDSQARDSNRVPSFVVQQSFDPSTSYYTQFYRPTADADGRFSPFLAPGGSTKYNGNMTVLPAQGVQASQESGNSIVLSTSGSTPLATQAAGVMQTSIAVPQQQVPVFRQPAGVHISHYPANYIPYSQYFSPFYVPPPALHPFLSSAAFPQQPPAGSVYPPPGAAAAATPVKFSLSQYKPGTNAINSTIVGMPTGYGTYNSSLAGYNPSPAVSSGNSTGNEDLNSSQFKENNVYIQGQQSEGSAVWIPAPGRDISSLQSSSFYSIPPQGQHMSFAPTQAGHGALGGIYHPTPTVAAAAVHPLLQQSQTVAGAVEVVGPPAGVYQQPQRAQINWTNNY